MERVERDGKTQVICCVSQSDNIFEHNLRNNFPKHLWIDIHVTMLAEKKLEQRRQATPL